MGLFDKLLRSIHMDEAANLVDKIGKNFSTEEESSTYSYQSQERYSHYKDNVPVADRKSYNALAKQLESTFATEYSSFTVRRNIPAAEMAAAACARDYTYGLYDAYGQPKAFIMLMRNRNDYQNNTVRLAKEAAEAQGVPYMNFMPHLPNEQSYVSNRLRQNIFG